MLFTPFRLVTMLQETNPEVVMEMETSMSSATIVAREVTLPGIILDLGGPMGVAMVIAIIMQATNPL